MRKRLGDPVQQGEALCTVHYNSAERMEAARLILERTIQVEAVAPTRRATLIRQTICES